MNDEFYIGWEAKAAPGIGKIVRAGRGAAVLAAIGSRAGAGGGRSTRLESVFLNGAR